MMVRLIRILGILWVVLYGCATPQPPLGGPKDETPPRIDTPRSTANYQVNFKKQPIELVFNEWIQPPQDVAKQVVVSPPIRYMGTLLKLKGKVLVIEFDDREELQENVTYTINLGEAIKDLSEGNAAKDLRFVFSTGPILDSLGMQGEVRDFITQKPLENILVMVYSKLNDSIVKKERPLYFGKTNKEGRFSIKNMREGEFKVFALEDANQPYLYDAANEKIAFADSLVRTGVDTNDLVSLRVFSEIPPLRLLTTDAKRYGLVNLQFNQPPKDVQIAALTPGFQLRTEVNRDTLKVWYAGTSTAANWSLDVRKDSTFKDTLSIKTFAPETYLRTAKLTLQNADLKEFQKLNPEKPLVLTFNHPLSSFDISKLMVVEDSVRQISPSMIEIDSLNSRKLILQYRWVESSKYQLRFAPGAVRDIYALGFRDTVRYNFQAMPRKNYGSIDLKVENLDSTRHYMMELMLGENTEPAQRERIDLKTKARFLYKVMEPSTYKVRLFEDQNRNGVWDTGNYFKHQQPEPIYIRELEALRPNWDLDGTVDWEERKKLPKN
ncbi:MAG: Ig-like domain-containing protein [Haliscomenobacter sp.]|uniref:Ig-like domain-containing protein n=1 Tax=Haliscomenobacter sp. TaxID=2717303 RepID=UPI0029BC69FD|nr:Ig-like domain-containing protein [Haliscomenobacter sp.]MDX2072508.1 Ig-like domain-containing protein [Haliscomenobacter sp.]